jgi:hypothetical protein
MLEWFRRGPEIPCTGLGHFGIDVVGDPLVKIAPGLVGGAARV